MSGPTLDAEKSVIGIMLMAPAEETQHVYGTLLARMFEEETLGKLFACMKKLHAEGAGVDVVTVLNVMGDEYKTLLVQCAETAPFVSHFDDYIALVLEGWRQRQIDYAMLDARMNGETAEGKIKRLRACLEEQDRITAAVDDRNARSFAECIDEAIEAMCHPVSRAAWPFKKLNERTGGLLPGGVYVIAARPGMGKTSFALRCACAQAVNDPVLYLSMEMTRVELTKRCLGRAAGIPQDRMRDGKFTENDLARLGIARRVMKSLHLSLDETTNVSLDTVRAKIAQYHPKILYLDHIGLMEVQDKKQKRNDELAALTRGLKLLAKKEGVSIVELCQLSRYADSGKVSLGNMFGSATIEHDADGVLAFTSEDPDAPVCRVALHVLKYRNGQVGELAFDWDKATQEYTPIEEAR